MKYQEIKIQEQVGWLASQLDGRVGYCGHDRSLFCGYEGDGCIVCLFVPYYLVMSSFPPSILSSFPPTHRTIRYPLGAFHVP